MDNSLDGGIGGSINGSATYFLYDLGQVTVYPVPQFPNCKMRIILPYLTGVLQEENPGITERCRDTLVMRAI